MKTRRKTERTLKATEAVGIPEQEPSPLLTPDDLIPDSDFDEIVEIIQAKFQERRDRWVGDEADSAAVLSLMFPDRKQELGMGWDEWNVLGRHFQDHYNNGRWVDLAKLASSMCMLYPDKRANIQKRIDHTAWEGMKQKLESFRDREEWYQFAHLAQRLLLIFPDRKQELQLDTEASDGALQALEELRRAKQLPSFANLAAFITLIFPERKGEITVDSETQGNFVEELQKVNKSINHAWRCKTALAIYILNAERAVITKDGELEIIPLQPSTPPSPTLPQRPTV